ncbi:MAG: thermonuclease family protein [Planctomycetaceae bacterium]|nr:thermonuclease family protein [Planctomycetaceae bacterium]
MRLVWFFNLRPSVDLAPGMYHVNRVVDGDTIVLDDGTRVRLMGVDCPESVKPNTPVEPYGTEATEFTRNWLASAGGNVRLEFDRERFDNFERTLAFVWHEEHSLNEDLLRAGLARWEANFSYASSMKTRFRKAQEAARQDQRGLWTPSQAAKP